MYKLSSLHHLCSFMEARGEVPVSLDNCFLSTEIIILSRVEWGIQDHYICLSFADRIIGQIFQGYLYHASYLSDSRTITLSAIVTVPFTIN